MTQLSKHQRVAKLLSRKSGTTAIEVAWATDSTCPHKRISEFRDEGWTIIKKQVKGKNYHRYFGIAPKAC
jgi:hypothetical protein